MTARLTDEMRRGLASNGNTPLDVEDPQSQARYVLLPKDLYDRIRAALQDTGLAESYALQEIVARSEGWDDPVMDEYNDYDQRKKTA